MRRPLVLGPAEIPVIKGRREGKAEALVQLSTLKGLAPDAESRARISACQDVNQRDRWLARVLTATRLAEVFGD